MSNPIDDLIAIISNLNKKLSKGKRGKGLQFKLNTTSDNADWAGTISLRCNRVNNETVSDVIKEIFDATNGNSDIVDRIGINKSVMFDRENSERKILDNSRTVYVTLRPSKEVFDVVEQGLGSQAEYTAPDVLTNALYEHKFATAETEADVAE